MLQNQPYNRIQVIFFYDFGYVHLLHSRLITKSSLLLMCF